MKDIEDFYNTAILASPQVLLFAIKDRTRIVPGTAAGAKGVFSQETFAGVMALLNTVPKHLQSEIGHIVILPAFQRTHVQTNASGLLLERCLNPPEKGGMGLRRVQWQANTYNIPSVEAAKKLGFQWEGVLRWHRLLPEGKGPLTNAKPRDDGLGAGRHNATLSFCWDDWEDGGRESVAKLMVLRKK